jgi:hypothetical protein
MSPTVDEYLRRLNPVYRKRNGRWVVGSESRQRTFAAVKEVLLAGGGDSDLRRAVALTLLCCRAAGDDARYKCHTTSCTCIGAGIGKDRELLPPTGVPGF